MVRKREKVYDSYNYRANPCIFRTLLVRTPFRVVKVSAVTFVRMEQVLGQK